MGELYINAFDFEDNLSADEAYHVIEYLNLRMISETDNRFFDKNSYMFFFKKYLLFKRA